MFRESFHYNLTISTEKLMLVAIIVLLTAFIALAVWHAHTERILSFENTYKDEFSDLYYDAERVWYEPTSEVHMG